MCFRPPTYLTKEKSGNAVPTNAPFRHSVTFSDLGIPIRSSIRSHLIDENTARILQETLDKREQPLNIHTLTPRSRREARTQS